MLIHLESHSSPPCATAWSGTPSSLPGLRMREGWIPQRKLGFSPEEETGESPTELLPTFRSSKQCCQ